MHGYDESKYLQEFPEARLICENSKLRNIISRLRQKEITVEKEIEKANRFNNPDFVKCEICGELLKNISNTHLKKHNITTKQYKKLYPDSPIRGKATQEKRDIISKKAIKSMNQKYRKLLHDEQFMIKKREAQRKGYKKLMDNPKYEEYLKKIERGRFARRYLCFFSKMKFRSKQEVQLAELLHLNGIFFKYEKVKIQTDDGRNYLPDFYIPSKNLIIEVKGKAFYTEYTEYRQSQCIIQGYNFEFIFDDEDTDSRFSEIITKYKLMI